MVLMGVTITVRLGIMQLESIRSLFLQLDLEQGINSTKLIKGYYMFVVTLLCQP